MSIKFDPKLLIDKLKYIMPNSHGIGEETRTNILVNALKNSNSIIAGGLLTSLYGDAPNRKSDFSDYYYPGTDIDIYVNQNEVSNFLREILKMEKCRIKLGNIAGYDTSFFSKNNIMVRYEIQILGQGDVKQVDIDVMVVSSVSTNVQVAQNFDLTFCEIWFDGENIYATDEKGVREKTGVLREEYLQNFIKTGNRFTKERLRKYMARGFYIKNVEEDITVDAISGDLMHIIDYKYRINNEGTDDRKNEEVFVKFVIEQVLMSYLEDNISNLVSR